LAFEEKAKEQVFPIALYPAAQKTSLRPANANRTYKTKRAVKNVIILLKKKLIE
jgi:hypothetical protein